MEVVSVDGRPSARWKVTTERWSNSDRPFAFALVGAEGRSIELSVTYTLISRGAQFWLSVILRDFWWPMPQS